MRITLTVTDGPHAGRCFSFTEHDTFIVGRAADAHFSLPEKDEFCSRHHFLIEVNPPLCHLVDLQSHNRTYVNGEPVQTADLRDGDRIKAGHTVLRVSLETTADDTPAPAAIDADAAAAVDAQAAVVGWEASAVVGTLREMQHENWGQGLRLPVEAYLEQWPMLASNSEGVLELIYGEYCLRQQAGERPGHTDFQRRFPQLADPLGRLLLLHDALIGDGDDNVTRWQGERRSEHRVTLSPCHLVIFINPRLPHRGRAGPRLHGRRLPGTARRHGRDGGDQDDPAAGPAQPGGDGPHPTPCVRPAP